MLKTGVILHGRYRVVSQIGQGGMGSVYKAVDTHIDASKTNPTVAIKQAFVLNEQANKAFESEARLLFTLRHPVLPQVKDFFVEENTQFLVMEFIEGHDLGHMLHESTQGIAVETVLGWADQLLDALNYLHNQTPPIIHRDIKPANIKLTPSNRIMLLDFGLAKGESNRSLMAFTVHYAPKEQIQGTGTDARSDLYALGATLYHLMTGHKVEGAMTRLAAVSNIQQDPQQPAHMINPRIPLPVSEALAIAMALEPDARYANAQEMQAALQQARQGHRPVPPAAVPYTGVTHMESPGRGVPEYEPTVVRTPPDSSIPVQPPPDPVTSPKVPVALIIGVVLVLVLMLVGGVTGVFLATSDSGGEGQPAAVTSPDNPSDNSAGGEEEPDEPTEAPAPELTEADAEPAAASTGTTPPLDNQIVFVSERDGNQEIYAMDANGANTTNLTNTSEADETSPVVSPDGTRIAYVLEGNIYVMNADGSDQTNLTNGNADSEFPTWSPNSSAIAFVADDRIFTVGVDGSAPEVLIDAPDAYRDLAWSPDGEQFAFELDGDIYVMQRDGRGRSNLTRSDDARDLEPAWSLDGQSIAFASDAGGEELDIHVMEANGRGQNNVIDDSDDPAVDSSPTWSPDGSQIAFRSNRGTGSDRDQDIYVMNADGSDQFNLTSDSDEGDMNPFWSP